MAPSDDRPCAPKLHSYYACLGANGHKLSQCLEQESQLLKCSNTDKSNDYCLDELKLLFTCTRNPTSDGCAKQFINFRECHRPGGREVLIKDGYYVVAPQHADMYLVNGNVICPTNAPQRSTSALKSTLDKLANACGFKNQTEQFKPSVKS